MFPKLISKLICDENRPANDLERALLIPGLAAILGGWMGALPIPLDWNESWQVRYSFSLFNAFLNARLTRNAWDHSAGQLLLSSELWEDMGSEPLSRSSFQF
jgi:hypothetical protein